MEHLGDITKISGSTAPVVDCVIGGSPCQDLSIAGRRAGLAGERSGLFMEQIRIVKEMREEDMKRGRTGNAKAIGIDPFINKGGYVIRYRWPEETLVKDGFAGDEVETELLPGEEYDRIGGEGGRFLSPLIDGEPQSYFSRAIPYYVPEKDIRENPSYHRYKIGARYTDSKCKRGTVAPAFWQNPPDGGGIQVSMGKSIETIKAECRGVFDGQ